MGQSRLDRNAELAGHSDENSEVARIAGGAWSRAAVT